MKEYKLGGCRIVDGLPNYQGLAAMLSWILSLRHLGCDG